MNPAEDVLVLFLTSHGSEDHRFSLDLPPLPLDTLDPSAPKRGPDEPGVRNRVGRVSPRFPRGPPPSSVGGRSERSLRS